MQHVVLLYLPRSKKTSARQACKECGLVRNMLYFVPSSQVHAQRHPAPDRTKSLSLVKNRNSFHLLTGPCSKTPCARQDQRPVIETFLLSKVKQRNSFHLLTGPRSKNPSQIWLMTKRPFCCQKCKTLIDATPFTSLQVHAQRPPAPDRANDKEAFLLSKVSKV